MVTPPEVTAADAVTARIQLIEDIGAALDRFLAESTARVAALEADLALLHGQPFSRRDYGAMAARLDAAEARVTALEQERDGMRDGWKAANVHMEMLRQTIEDKYPAPPNFYLRALLTQVNEAQARVTALEAAVRRMIFVIEESPNGAWADLQDVVAEAKQALDV